MLKSFIYLVFTLLLISCGENIHTNYATEEQTDKKFVGKWKIINDPGDSRTSHLTKVPGSPKTYHFTGMFDEHDFVKWDDNTLVVLDKDGKQSYKLEYHPENDHIICSLHDDYEHADEFIRVE